MAEYVFITGDRGVKFRLEHAGTIIGTALDEAAHDAATLLEETAKQLAPEGASKRLRRSIFARVQRRGGIFLDSDGSRGAEISVQLGWDYFLAPYAVYVNQGSGIYAGHTSWTIYPKQKKALAFSSGGTDLVRNHATIRGMHGVHFIENAVSINAATIEARFAAAGKQMAEELSA